MIYIDETIPKKIDIEKLNNAIDWAYKKFDFDIDISIGFDTFSGGFTGDVGLEDSEMSILLSRRIGTESAIKTIFHELVHVQQIIDKRLTYDDSADRQLWDGVPFFGKYEDSPWEKEAWDLEEILMEEYQKYVQTSQDVV